MMKGTAVNDLDKALNSIDRWYGSYIPHNILSRRFMEFVADNHELARQISIAKTKFVAKIPTACTDGKEIMLPVTYLQPEFFESLGIAPEDYAVASLACINGSQVHEALHVRFTSNCNLDEALKSCGHRQDLYKEHPELCRAATNLIEDLWIEGPGMREYAGLRRFIEAKNTTLFGSRQLPQLSDALADPELTHMNFVAWASFLKDTGVRVEVVQLFADAGYEPLVEWLVNFPKNNYSFTDRLRSSLDFVDMLLKSTLKEDEKVPSLSNMIDGAGQPLSPAEAEALEQLLEELGQAELDRTAVAMNRMLSESEEFKRVIHNREGGKVDLSMIGPAEVIDVMDMPPSYSETKLEPTREWLVLGRALHYARSENHTPGRPRDEGTHLLSNRLAHIVIDGQVLAHRDRLQLKRGVPELIILIDHSGSMRGHGDTQYGNLLLKTAAAALGGFTSMLNARLPCAVYAHTNYEAGSYGHDEPGPELFAVAAYEMPLATSRTTVTSNFKQRFAKLTTLHSYANYDGLAIEAAAKRFTSRQGSKLLLVLSDGQPHSYRYSGKESILHTAHVVDELRKGGMHVLCGSLVQEVVKNNDEIYGSKYNVHAYGSNLERAIREIVMRLSTM